MRSARGVSAVGRSGGKKNNNRVDVEVEEEELRWIACFEVVMVHLGAVLMDN